MVHIKKQKVKIIGWGNALAKHSLHFGEDTRYRLESGETLLDLAAEAAKKALNRACR